MLKTLHRAGHRWLKPLFVLACAGSSSLFFMGAAFPHPPGLLVAIIGLVLGVAVEWTYYTVSCDLTQAISEGSPIIRDLLYTLLAGAASWFFLTNAALHVGWAPTDELLGLSRPTWAMIMAALIVGIIFALSARREPPEKGVDIQAQARAVEVLMPEASRADKVKMLAALSAAAAKQLEGPKEAEEWEDTNQYSGKIRVVKPRGSLQPGKNTQNGRGVTSGVEDGEPGTN